MEYRVINIREYGEEELHKWFSEADDQRREKILRLRYTDDQLRSLCADHLARVMLAKQFHCDASALQFYRTARGKPYLEGNPLHFNLSHSGDFVACAVDFSPIGIDIEAIRPVPPALCKKVCTAEELSYVYEKGEFSSLRFLLLWTAKEAALKMRGLGIRPDLSAFPVMANGRFFLPDCSFMQKQNERYVLTIAQK